MAQKLINIKQARPRYDALDADAAVLRMHVLEQLALHQVARREVYVAAFGRRWQVTLAVPEKAGHAHACAGSDQRCVARHRHAFVEREELVDLERGDAMRGRFELIVE